MGMLLSVKAGNAPGSVSRGEEIVLQLAEAGKVQNSGKHGDGYGRRADAMAARRYFLS